MKTRTMRGKLLDMGALIQRHETKRAVGNAQMNARGDKIDQSGRVLKRFEQVRAEYNAGNPRAVRSVSLKNLAAEVMAGAVSPVEALKAQKTAEDAPKRRKLSDDA